MDHAVRSGAICATNQGVDQQNKHGRISAHANALQLCTQQLGMLTSPFSRTPIWSVEL